MLDRALDARGSSLDAIPTEVLDRFLHEARLKRLEELLAEVALGNRMPDVVARHLLALRDGQSDDVTPGAGMAREKIRITGAERGVLSFANCCHPLPGDAIIGHVSPGKGIVVHREECPNVAELRKSPERYVDIEWDRDVQGDYRAELRIEVINRPGVLATIAAAIAAADSNIENVEYIERDLAAAALLFAIEVKNRKHLAEVIRRVRRTGVVSGVYRYPL
jgi:guanosine-3',5'-bis(diphosphate) 3'-pyrophosphohydrolase